MKKILKKQLKKTFTPENIFTTAQHLIPQHELSKVAGKLAQSRHPLVKKALVLSFAKAYGITLDEYNQKDFNKFDSFNDFFTRELEEDARPIDKTPHSIVSPADGVISQIGSINKQQLLQAKGRYYRLNHLLADTNIEDSHHYDNGTFATIYLAPSNYHRVHMPFDGTLVKTRYVPGSLFSVNNVTAAKVPDLFARNERLICEFDTKYGRAAVIMVGAMIVAGIETVVTGKIERTDNIQIQVHNQDLKKGDELGRFYLGSTAIVIMPQAAGIKWQSELTHNSTIKMGQLLGVANSGN